MSIAGRRQHRIQSFLRADRFRRNLWRIRCRCGWTSVGHKRSVRWRFERHASSRTYQPEGDTT